MRNNRSTILPFDFIQLPKRILNNSIRQPLLQFRLAQRFNQAKMCFGFKDNSMNYAQEEKQDFFNLIFNFIPIIDPESPWLIVWNLIAQAALLYNFFMAVLVISFTQLAFYTDITTTAGYTINILSLVVLYIDIIVRLHVGFYRRERLIQNRKDVFLNYFKYQFFFDLFANMCLTVYVTGQLYTYAFVRLGVYMRFVGLARMDESVIQNLNNSPYLLFIYKIVRMVMISWLFTTWGACIFFILDYIYYVDPSGQFYQNGLLWLRNTGDFQNIDIIQTFQQWYIWYEYALYWSIQTSVTTGYGDLTAKNPAQIIFSNIFMILMTVLFAYFVNYVLESMLQLQDSTNSDENWTNLIKYLKTFQLSQTQRDIISTQMKKIYEDKAEESFRTFFLQNISSQLRDEYEQATKTVFFRQNIFLHYFSDYNHLILHYVYALNEARFNQQERIYEQKQLDLNLYYIQKGTVILGISDKRFAVKNLVEGQLFGEQEFYHEVSRVHFAKAFSFVKLWMLNFSQFKQIAFNKSSILNNTKESFFQLMQDFKIYKFMFHLESKKCWICDKQYHNILECKQRFYFYEGQKTVSQKSERHRSFVSLKSENNGRHDFMRANHVCKKQIKQHLQQRQETTYEILYNFSKYRNSFNPNTFS